MADNELELYKRADEVLYYVWNPIGVPINPLTRDEYQEYLPRVFAMLQEECAASLIAAFLDNITTERMGLDGNPEHTAEVAKLLLEWKTELYRSP